MPEETTATQTTETTETTETKAGETKTAEESKGSWIDEFLKGTGVDTDVKEDEKEIMIPKKRFDSVNTKMKELADASKAKEAEYAEYVKAAEKDKATLTEVQDAAKAATARVAKLEGTLQTMLDSKLATIDEAYHELIPKDGSIEDRLSWVATAEAKGLFGVKQMEIEIGGMSNPSVKAVTAKTEGLSPLQMMAMGYGG
ncbi:hypothetical protein [Bacillus wiedmannii]|uniref:hypothetical protein n=1 Tax=Bacillus wiedmannii TaxID=1890302 RepID=UPI000BF202AB|nr:hypothetical protein [Bacillus wiedmannii]PEM08499.1 hypothetical protein CN610_19800 [Bacillus wiedmannii]